MAGGHGVRREESDMLGRGPRVPVVTLDFEILRV